MDNNGDDNYDSDDNTSNNDNNKKQNHDPRRVVAGGRGPLRRASPGHLAVAAGAAGAAGALQALERDVGEARGRSLRSGASGDRDGSRIGPRTPPGLQGSERTGLPSRVQPWRPGPPPGGQLDGPIFHYHYHKLEGKEEEQVEDPPPPSSPSPSYLW